MSGGMGIFVMIGVLVPMALGIGVGEMHDIKQTLEAQTVALQQIAANTRQPLTVTIGPPPVAAALADALDSPKKGKR